MTRVTKVELQIYLELLPNNYICLIIIYQFPFIQSHVQVASTLTAKFGSHASLSSESFSQSHSVDITTSPDMNQLGPETTAERIQLSISEKKSEKILLIHGF